MKKWVLKTAFLFFCVAAMFCKPLFADWIFTPEDEWHFITENGEWLKNSTAEKDGFTFYLDDTGHVYKNGLKVINNIIYYFNDFGAMESDCWVKVDSDKIEEKTEPIPEYYYYYLGKDGKAIKGIKGKPKLYIIDSKKYLFNEYGQLLIGFIKEDGTLIDPRKNEHAYEEAYYCTNSDGEIIPRGEKKNETLDEQGWKFTPEDLWHYVDENGEFVKNSIVEKDGLKFYLDDTGHVFKEGMVTFNNNVTYYFNYFGAMASNCWVKVDPDTVEEKTEPIPEYYYYYCGPDGKMIKGENGKPRFYRLEGKTYLFNEYGQLLIGWINEDGIVIDSDENEHPYEDALYYSNSEGELVSGWLKAENTYNDIKYIEDMKNLWFYFEPKTFKKRGYRKVEEKDIGTSHYIFSDKGYLYIDFVAYVLNNDRQEAYYGEDKGGKKYKAQWAWTLPPDDGTYSEEELDEKHWMYLEKSGKPVKNEIKKINNKYYSFSENGIMQTGIVAYLNGTILFVADMDLTSHEDIVKKGKFTYKKNGEVYYFYDPWYANKYDDMRHWYYSGSDWYDVDVDDNLFVQYEYATMDSEVNAKRDFSYTGRKVWDLDPTSATFLDVIKDDIGYLYNNNIQYFYFGDDGARVEKTKKVHMMDGEYTYGADKSGHYHGYRGGKYYYDGFLLAADSEIGYGIYTVETSIPATKQKLLYDYLFRPSSYDESKTIYVDPDDYDNVLDSEFFNRPVKYDWFYRSLEGDVDNESLYKVLDTNGKIVKSKNKSYKDKQGRYWFIDGPENSFRGLFDTEIRKMSSKTVLNTILDKNTCPREFVNGTKDDMIKFFKKITDNPDDPADTIYLSELVFPKDFKDAYTFDLSGMITDVVVTPYNGDENKLQVTITYNGVCFKAMRNEKNVFIPFGIKDENGLTATFFPGYNDFEIRPDDNDLFVNCNWADEDSVDLFDYNGDGVVDYWP